MLVMIGPPQVLPAPLPAAWHLRTAAAPPALRNVVAPTYTPAACSGQTKKGMGASNTSNFYGANVRMMGLITVQGGKRATRLQSMQTLPAWMLLKHAVRAAEDSRRAATRCAETIRIVARRTLACAQTLPQLRMQGSCVPYCAARA